MDALKELKNLNSLWSSLVRDINFGFFNFKGNDADRIDKKREVGALFKDCYKLLDPSERIYEENFLSNKPNFNKELPLLISSCNERLKTLNESLKKAEFDLSIISAVETDYAEKQKKYSQIKKIDAKATLSAMAERIIIDEYITGINKLAEKLSFKNKRFVKDFNGSLKLKASELVDVYLKDPKEMAKSGEKLKEQLEFQLSQTYNTQFKEFDYYKRLGQVRKLIDEFRTYLDEPEWAVESSVTKQSKQDRLDNITESLTAESDIVTCYKSVKYAICSSAESLKDDINPRSIDVINYLYYWIMKLCRALKSIITQKKNINKKDELANKLSDAVKMEIDSSAGNDDETSPAPPISERFNELFKIF